MIHGVVSDDALDKKLAEIFGPIFCHAASF